VSVDETEVYANRSIIEGSRMQKSGIIQIE
jgi:hypothetical protein